MTDEKRGEFATNSEKKTIKRYTDVVKPRYSDVLNNVRNSYVDGNQDNQIDIIIHIL